MLIFNEDEENASQRNELIAVVALLGLPTLVVAILWGISFKRIVFVEFMGPAMFICFDISLVVINSRQLDATNRQNQIFILTLM